MVSDCSRIGQQRSQYEHLEHALWRHQLDMLTREKVYELRLRPSNPFWLGHDHQRSSSGFYILDSRQLHFLHLSCESGRDCRFFANIGRNLLLDVLDGGSEMGSFSELEYCCEYPLTACGNSCSRL